MKITRREHLGLMAGAAVAAVLPGAARADGHAVVHEVMMMNRHPDNGRERNVFVPDIVRANVGDTIKFIPTDRGHNSQVDEDMMPEGGDTWRGRISNEVEVTVTTEGAYGYYCQPHRSTGMVGLVLVGDVSGNYEAAKEQRQRGKAKQRYEDIFARADALLAAEA